jgi:glutamine amidotransferase
VSGSVVVVDYGMGNLRSVSKAIEKIGTGVEVTGVPAKVRHAERLVLPGVGAFGKAVENLGSAGLLDAVLDFLQKERPFLGICLGLQLLFEGSEEEEEHSGLKVLSGKVKRFGAGFKVPHMGWNAVKQVRETSLFDDVPDESYMYFVHSYYATPEDDEITVGTTQYGVSFSCAVQRGNMAGLQFHPEKSQALGLRVLENFVVKL